MAAEPKLDNSGAPRWRLGRRPALDGLRGVAILFVMGQHFGVPSMNTGGAVGVSMFFVLSGFLITTLLLEERERTGQIDLRAFYVRRARRLLPALIVMLTFYVLFEAGRGQLEGAVVRASAALFYVGNWAQSFMNMGELWHTWSLSVEEQFYAVWAVLVVVGLAFVGRGPLIVVAVALGAAAVGVRAAGMWIGALERSVDPLMIGCLLAFVATAGRLPRSQMLGNIGAGALVVLAFVPFESQAAWTIGILAVGVATAALISASMAPGRLARVLSWSTLTAIGRVSYALYLWHYIVMWILKDALVAAGWPWPAIVAALSAVTMLCAVASWRYLERHFQRRTSAAEPSTEPDAPSTPAVVPAV